MNKTEKVEPYQAYVSEETLSKWSGIVSVWSAPKSPVEGAKVIDEIKEPVEVTVVDEQGDVWGSKARLAKIKYGEGREGWVLLDALTVKK